jgi:hypothetical protein
MNSSRNEVPFCAEARAEQERRILLLVRAVVVPRVVPVGHEKHLCKPQDPVGRERAGAHRIEVVRDLAANRKEVLGDVVARGAAVVGAGVVA